MLNIHTILHPTDFSQQSEFALPVACALARDYHARLVILHALMPPALLYGTGVFPDFPGTFAEKARNQLELLELPIPDIEVERRVVEGDRIPTILNVARETHADLIVMGSHGRSALARLFMGSIADNVIHKSPCPVLTVTHPVSALEAGNVDRLMMSGRS